MKRILLLSFLSISFCAANAQKKITSQEVVTQLVKNLHGGGEVTNVDGRSSFYVYAGTGYKYYFYKEKAYFYPQLDFKWGQYRYDSNSSNYTETTSLAVPLLVGYDLFAGVNVYTGVRYEQILNTSYNTYTSKVNNSQVGVLGGASVRLADKFGLSVSYYYGLTSLYQDGTGRTSSFTFAFNF